MPSDCVLRARRKMLRPIRKTAPRDRICAVYGGSVLEGDLPFVVGWRRLVTLIR